MTAIRNRSIDIFRRDRRDKTQRTYEFDLDLVLAPGSVEGDAARVEDFRRLRATLQQLPPLQRQALALAYFGGLTHVQIAERLKLPVGTVKTRVRLALHKIRTSDLFADGPRPRENARR